MVYSWKPTSRIKADAQKAGEMCEELERTVGLTPQTLLDANRQEGTLLHDEFEWNDEIAAEAYRETQARYIIRNLCVASVSEEKQPTRAFYSIVQEEEIGRKYESLDVIVASEDKASKLLQAAQKELLAFKHKYETLAELKAVFDAIDGVTQEG